MEKVEGDHLVKKPKKEFFFMQVVKQCKHKKNVHSYENEPYYYGKRIGNKGIDDPRLFLFKKTWFKDKDVLDVGCHEGYIAIIHVKRMYGIDIDEGIYLENTGGPYLVVLIAKAYKHLETDTKSANFVEDSRLRNNNTKFYDAVMEFQEEQDYNLLNRVSFEATNFLEYKIDRDCIDTVLCLSVTKWVHLNWGDNGLMQLFQKMFDALCPGGVLILEPQVWKSYRRNRKTTKAIHENFLKLNLWPNDFMHILINKIGFKSCELVARTIPGIEKGFDRQMYLYTK